MSLEDRIERILKHSGGEWSISDFMELVNSRRVHLFNYSDILIIAEVQQYPQKRLLHIWGVEGETTLEKLPGLVDFFKEVARTLDCTELRCQGRKGWERALLQHGGRVLYTTILMEL